MKNRFISFSQLLISAITLVFHTLIASRAPQRAFAVSQAYACAVAALALMYAVVLMDSNYHAIAFGSTTLFGPLPLSANIGLAWIIMLVFGAVGMSIQDVTDRQKTALMLHPFGYHMVVALPCLMLIATKHSSLNTIGLGICWTFYLVLQILSRCFYEQTAYKDLELDGTSRQRFFNRIWHSFTYPFRRMQTYNEMDTGDKISFFADMAGKAVFLIMVLVAYASATGSQGILCLVLLLISALQQLNVWYFVDWVLDEEVDEPVHIGKGWADAPVPDDGAQNVQLPAPTAPELPTLASGELKATARFRMSQPELHLPVQWRDKTV